MLSIRKCASPTSITPCMPKEKVECSLLNATPNLTPRLQFTYSALAPRQPNLLFSICKTQDQFDSLLIEVLEVLQKYSVPTVHPKTPQENFCKVRLSHSPAAMTALTSLG
ncbi:hypothetical protein ACMFMG_008115 [Clarireedia jacksonii]